MKSFKQHFVVEANMDAINVDREVREIFLVVVDRGQGTQSIIGYPSNSIHNAKYMAREIIDGRNRILPTPFDLDKGNTLEIIWVPSRADKSSPIQVVWSYDSLDELDDYVENDGNDGE